MADSHIRAVVRPAVPSRVVVACEDPVSRHRLCETLEADGWEVAVAPNGAVLMSHMASWLLDGSHRPADLLVLDASMPGLAGIELLASLRRLGRPIPAIVLGCSGGDQLDVWRMGDAHAVGAGWDLAVVRALAARILRKSARTSAAPLRVAG